MESQSNASSSRAAARGDRPAPGLLEVTDRDAFMRSVEQAKLEALDAAEAAEDLALWVERLEPYFERVPEISVAEALQRYLADRRATSPGVDEGA